MEEHVRLAREAIAAGLIVTELMPMRTTFQEYAVQLWAPDGTLWAEGRYESAESVGVMISRYIEDHPQPAHGAPNPAAADDLAACVETDYDHRGDCDGPMETVLLRVNHAGGRAGEYLSMCSSHAGQAAMKREATVIRTVAPGRD